MLVKQADMSSHASKEHRDWSAEQPVKEEDIYCDYGLYSTNKSVLHPYSFEASIVYSVKKADDLDLVLEYCHFTMSMFNCISFHSTYWTAHITGKSLKG